MKRIVFAFALLISLFSFAQSLDAQIVRSAHASRANKFAQQASAQLMRGICPNTGRDAYAVVKQWIYDEDTNEYEIALETYWTGATCIWCDDQQFEVDGKLVVSANGNNPRFTRTWESAAVVEARRNINWFTGAAVVLVAMAASNSGN